MSFPVVPSRRRPSCGAPLYCGRVQKNPGGCRLSQLQSAGNQPRPDRLLRPSRGGFAHPFGPFIVCDLALAVGPPPRTNLYFRQNKGRRSAIGDREGARHYSLACGSPLFSGSGDKARLPLDRSTEPFCQRLGCRRRTRCENARF